MLFGIESSVAQVVGYIPDQLRESFDRSLPISDIDEQRRLYTSTWFFNDTLSGDKLHPDIEHLMPCIELVIELGGLTLHAPNQHLSIDVVQANADMMGGGLGMHRDGFNGDYRRAVVGNVSNPRYKSRFGRTKSTPNYGILAFDGAAQHEPRTDTSICKRTRLRVTRMDPFGR